MDVPLGMWVGPGDVPFQIGFSSSQGVSVTIFDYFNHYLGKGLARLMVLSPMRVYRMKIML